jgi:hypothetical protein
MALRQDPYGQVKSLKRSEVYWKVPGLGQKRYSDITYSILAAISFKIVSLGSYTVIPLFFHASKAPWK